MPSTTRSRLRTHRATVGGVRREPDEPQQDKSQQDDSEPDEDSTSTQRDA